jgi:glycosyltransferase involved in cell wall biosynthesis
VVFVSPPWVDVEDGSTHVKPIAGKGKRFWDYTSQFLPAIFFEFLELSYNIYAYFAIKAVLRRSNIDMIYERYALFSFAGFLAAKKYGTPLLLEVNDSAVVERRRSLICRRLAQKIEQWVFIHALGIITISNMFKKIIVGEGVKPIKVEVMHNAIDPKLFHVDAFCRSNLREEFHLVNKVVIGYTGGFAHWHQLPFMVDVIAELVIEHPQLHCILVGDGPDRPSLLEYVKKRGITKHFSFVGTKPHNQIPGLISAMDIALLPNCNDYCSPVKVFEFMAMGKAVVAPKLPNLEEILTNGFNGFLFEPQNKRDLIDSLSHLVKDEETRQCLGRNARQTVYQKHLWINNAKEVVRFYRKLTSKW